MMYNQQFQSQAPQNAPYAYTQASAPSSVYQQPPVQSYAIPQPPEVASQPKKGWGALAIALACLPVIVLGEVFGLLVSRATPLDDTLGAELGGALFAMVLCGILGGSKMFNITRDSWMFAWRAMWWSIAVSAGIAILNLYSTVALGEMILVFDWPWQAFLSVALCLGIGFLEEFMVRGLILNGLLARMGASRKGILWACIISSVVFGLMHVNLSSLATATPLELLQAVLKVIQTGTYGFALAAVVCKTGELVSAALLHALDDWLLYILTFIMGGSITTEYVSSGTEEGWATVTVYVVCIVLYIPLVIRAVHTLNEIDVPNRGAFFKLGASDLRTAPAPAGYAAPVPAPSAYTYTAPDGRTYVYAAPAPAAQPQPYAQPQPCAHMQPATPAAPSSPANPIPTQIPEGSLYRTGRSDAPGAQTPQDPQTFR